MVYKYLKIRFTSVVQHLIIHNVSKTYYKNDCDKSQPAVRHYAGGYMYICDCKILFITLYPFNKFEYNMIIPKDKWVRFIDSEHTYCCRLEKLEQETHNIRDSEGWTDTRGQCSPGTDRFADCANYRCVRWSHFCMWRRVIDKVSFRHHTLPRYRLCKQSDTIRFCTSTNNFCTCDSINLSMPKIK